MIYSSIEDNFFRVQIMHNVLSDYYQISKESDFRNRHINGGNFFPFSGEKYEAMEKESSLVGMVMAWSAVTLECLINHVIAENLNNKNVATVVIEYPKIITEKLGIAKNSKSELSKKIAILAYPNDKLNEILRFSDEISDYRNLIVHDKPFDYNGFAGDVEMSHFKSRGRDLEKLRYEKLTDFYIKCDGVVGFIFGFVDFSESSLKELSFGALLKTPSD